MSRIGKKPIPIPAGVEITVGKDKITVKGPKGTLEREYPADKVAFELDEANKVLVVKRFDDSKPSRAFHGLWRALVNNMVIGVSEGFKKVLEIVGTGYRAQARGKKLTLQIGFSHPVEFEMPPGLEVQTPAPTQIIIAGCDKQAVGQMAANIRAVRPPEPYKGKGIRYQGEYVRRLAGKSFGSAGS
ncbi:MAG: 50S ribosomal protein L6 [Planctomycetota bacterium]|nr:MAG: 50S ribosomal protein L6 [Planctomycetota bacterium]